jgi:hydrogenase maturation protease
VSHALELLVLGLGNPLCGDDGAGVAAVARLAARRSAPRGAQVLDGGTLGLALLPHLQSARRAILVDAVRTGDPPGTIVRLEGDDVARAAAHKLSPHQVGVADLLDGALLSGRRPDPIVLVGIVPAQLELGTMRSRAVERGIDALVEAVAAEAERMGFAMPRRYGPRAAADERAARLLGL